MDSLTHVSHGLIYYHGKNFRDKTYLHYSYPCGNKLPPDGVRKGSNGCLCSAIDRSARITLSTRNAANIDYVSSATIVSTFVDRQNGLGHVDQACHIGREHHLNVLLRNVRCFGYALYEAPTGFAGQKEASSILSRFKIRRTHCSPKRLSLETQWAKSSQNPLPHWDC